MDDTLKRLLDAEQQAQAMVAKSIAERDRMIDQALEEVKTADARFRARIPELRDSFRHKAEERAEQAVAEIRRRHAERRESLVQETARRSDRAARIALEALLTSDGR